MSLLVIDRVTLRVAGRTLLDAAELRSLACDEQRIPKYMGVLSGVREAARRALQPRLEVVP